MSQTPTDQSAREALRARQGKGARYDATDAPHDDLLLARRGAAYFTRKLGEMTDADLNGPSLRPGWSRRQLIAQVGYSARHLAHLVVSVRTGAPIAPSPSDAVRQAEIELGATLPAHALRSLVHHATIHLDVEWRDLTSAHWDVAVTLPDGTEITLRNTPHLRAHALWHSAVDLGNGGRAADIPASF